MKKNLNIKNKKAFFDYKIEKQIEAGMVLTGSEVKCIKSGHVNIREAYIKIIKNEVYIIGMTTNPPNYITQGGDYDSRRTVKLLLNKKEINQLIGDISINGYTIVPIDLHIKNNKIKITIGVAKGKNTNDKRQTEKDREWSREKARISKKNYK